MVVSLLALLFLLVTGFLSVARTQERTFGTLTEGNVRDEILDGINAMVVGQIKAQLFNDQGKLMGGGASARTETVPGYGKSHWLAALEPLWNEGWLPDPGHIDDQTINETGYRLLDQIVWSAVSALEGSLVSKPEFVSIVRLMFENARDDDALFEDDDVRENVIEGFMDADGDGIPDASFTLDRLATEKANAYLDRPVRLPDRTNTEFLIYSITGVNNTDGGPVPVGKHANVPPREIGEVAWRRFLRTARFTAAVRVVSHGGMVTLDGTQPMRGFLMDLFNAVKDPDDDKTHRLSDSNPVIGEMFAELAAARSQVEAALRHRFLLPLANDGSRLRVPRILAILDGTIDPGRLTRDWQRLQFPETFNPQFPGPSGHRLNDTVAVREGRLWQRVNLADPTGGNVDPARDRSERGAWARTQVLRPVDANNDSLARPVASGAYARRHLITTVSTGDLLARKLDATEPFSGGATPTEPVEDLHTWRGEQKFYLGDIVRAFEPQGTAGYRYAFDTGNPFDPRKSLGPHVVKEVARRFFDMLGGHDGWFTSGLVDETPNASNEVVSRRAQALMLAVNTVAFAAPRDTRGLTAGWIDPVVYPDDPTGGPPLYVGYAPQPFITEVIAYYGGQNRQGPPGGPIGGMDFDFALAVELYNPNDPFFDGSDDVFALNLNQFRLRLSGRLVDKDVPLAPLALAMDPQPPLPYMNGRSFLVFAIEQEETTNEYFRKKYRGLPVDGRLILPGGKVFKEDPDTLRSTDITVELQRLSKVTGQWYTVDKVSVDIKDVVGDVGQWWSAYRDTAPTPYFALIPPDVGPDFDGDGLADGSVDLDGDGFADGNPARWSVVVNLTRSASGQGRPGRQSMGQSSYRGAAGIGNPDMPDRPPISVAFDPGTGLPTDDPNTGVPVDPWMGKRFAPIVPLVTMNAAPRNDFTMFGEPSDLRPRSFPTPGFMLFVPRFSHVIKADGSSLPVSEVLRLAWEAQSYQIRQPDQVAGGFVPGYPADFGHMPIFDNTQPVKAGSYFDDTDNNQGVGRLPWGLLVFDYFTTLDPQYDANGDGQPDVDPASVPGMIDINNAPWFVLSKLPMLGPLVNSGRLPRWYAGGRPNPPVTREDPSPSFWDPLVGVLTGTDLLGQARNLAVDPMYTMPGAGGNLRRRSVPYLDPSARGGRYRLGPWLAQAAVAYRDGIQTLSDRVSLSLRHQPWAAYADAHLRNRNGFYVRRLPNSRGVVQSTAPFAYRPALYGAGSASDRGGIRGARPSQTADPNDPSQFRPTQFGFVTVGELLNVKGFDASRHTDLPSAATGMQTPAFTPLGRGDFVKAVSLMALLDTQYLTTRSHTFTVYVSLVDRENRAASVRSQITVDRSNLLPRLSYEPLVPGDPTSPRVPAVRAFRVNDNTTEVRPIRLENPNAMPTVVAQRRSALFNARYDN